MIFEMAKPEDFQAVNRLARQVCEHHAQWDKSLIDVEEPYPMDWFQECIQAGSIRSNTIFVAREGERVVGFMRFYLWETGSFVTQKRTMLSIDDIGVEESLRHQGVGSQMMDSLRTLAKEWGCSDLCLYVDAPNESAIAFYKKCGFQIKNLGMRAVL